MAETKTKKPSKSKSSLIGNQAKPVVLDSTTKLDIDTNKVLIDNIIEAGLQSKLDISAIDRFTSISNARDQVYQLIDTMCNDSAVSAIVRTYTDDVCEMADNGHIVWCESSDPNISKFVNYLLNIMNVDKQIGKWVYCLIKYGDVYLRLYRESDYHDVLFNRVDRTKQALNEDVNLSIHSTNDNYSYYIEMVPDPSTMFELTRHGQTFGYIETPNKPNNFDTTSYVGGTTGMMSGNSNGAYTFAYKTNDVNIYQADDFVHAALEDNISRFPETVELFYETLEDTKDIKRKTGSNTGTSSQSYTVRRGKSLLYDSYKIWREKALLESSVLLSRVTRSGIVRKVAVEVGDMPKEQVQQTLRRVKELFEQRSAYVEGGSMSEYTNPSPVENFIYYATHNGQGNITVESVGGDFDPKQLTDLDWWNNKFYASYGIPKQYFGWCLAKDTEILLLDGTTHTIEELCNNKDEFIGKDIMACDTDGSLKPTTITNIMLTNEHAKLLRIWLDNGKYVDVTPDHRMMLRNGEFVEAKDLKENDSLMPYYDKTESGRYMVLDNKTGKWICQSEKDEPIETEHDDKIIDRLVVKIESLSDDNVVYDLSVAADCHTFALPCGIFVHNCDDGAGFNGGSSLSIISSVYAKGVKRIQNTILQAITDAINLILLNKGCKSYLNNFVLRMQAPVTLEEQTFRSNFSDRVTAISNVNSLFSDVEDKARRLTILKSLVGSLHLGDEIVAEIQKEIEAAEEAAKKAEEEAAAEAKESNSESNDELDLSTESGDEDDLDLTPMPDAELKAEENFKPASGTSTLNEEQLFEDDDDLPTPEEADSERDFTENN